MFLLFTPPQIKMNFFLFMVLTRNIHSVCRCLVGEQRTTYKVGGTQRSCWIDFMIIWHFAWKLWAFGVHYKLRISNMLFIYWLPRLCLELKSYNGQCWENKNSLMCLEVRNFEWNRHCATWENHNPYMCEFPLILLFNLDFSYTQLNLSFPRIFLNPNNTRKIQ